MYRMRESKSGPRLKHMFETTIKASDGYAMLMRPNMAETAVHGCHYLGDMAVRMR